MLTFDSLELTHTCCTFGDPRCYTGRLEMPKRKIKNQMEIYRIHDKERLDLQLLETLTKDFTAKFTDLGVSLNDFFTGYRKERMEEDLYRNEATLADQLGAQHEHCLWLKEHKDLEHDFLHNSGWIRFIGRLLKRNTSIQKKTALRLRSLNTFR